MITQKVIALPQKQLLAGKDWQNQLWGSLKYNSKLTGPESLLNEKKSSWIFQESVLSFPVTCLASPIPRQVVVTWIISLIPGMACWCQDADMDCVFKILSLYILTCLVISFFFNFYCHSITVVCIFSPSFLPTPAEPTSLPCLHPPLWFCPRLLYSSSWKHLSPLSPPHSPLAIVRLFISSMSLVIFCLLFSFVDYVPVKAEIIWYLSLTTWLISLSIMLSSSIYAIAKGRRSFFLSAA